MPEQDVFILADQALKAVVDQIRDDQWDQSVPVEMTPRQPGSTLRTVVNYHAYDDAWVPDVLAGKTKEARADFALLLLTPSASDETRHRAQMAMALIDSGTAASLPSIVKTSMTMPAPPPSLQQAGDGSAPTDQTPPSGADQ